MNKLYFGDNLAVLREQIADESVDLVYLDPPFNSDARYNVLFRSAEGDAAKAQAEAFRDTWTWDHEASWAFTEIARIGGTTASFVNALHSALGQSDLMAYLVMMAVRLHELRRVMKPTASLYLHCDPTASHYLKVILDGVFGPTAFTSEIIWKRTNARSTKGKWPSMHDVILYYSRAASPCFAEQKTSGAAKAPPHTLVIGPDGAKYNTYELTGPGMTKDGPSGRPWRGFDPGVFGRHWAKTAAELEQLDADGLIHWPRNGGFPRGRRAEVYVHEGKQVTVGDVWSDIERLNQAAKERLGYPTQKPLALIERIVRASSRPGDVVLDPFCGCGTTTHAAQALGRRWIGIDVAYHAIKVIEDRLRTHFGAAAVYDVAGIPADLESARRLAERDKYQFQWWANYLVGVQQMREVKRGRDRGIDGEIFFAAGPGRGLGRVLTSVKGGRSVGVPELREFKAVLDRENADGGLFICLRRPTPDMRREAAGTGFYQIGRSSYPKLQVVSIEEWFEGERPELPTMAHIARRAAEPAVAATASVRKRRTVDPRQGEMLMPVVARRDGVHLNPVTAFGGDAPAAIAIGE